MDSKNAKTPMTIGRRRFLLGMAASAVAITTTQLVGCGASEPAAPTQAPVAAEPTKAPEVKPTETPAVAQATATPAPAPAEPTATVAPMLATPTAQPKPEMFPGPEKANIDWKQFAGSEIHWLGGLHPVSETLIKMAPEFEALTGIKTVVEQIDWNTFSQKRMLDIAAPEPLYDTYMAMFWDDWQYGSEGLLVDQNEFLNDPKLTDLEWLDLQDISPGIQGSAMWDGVAGNPLGSGRRTCIPYMIETYILAYRTDIFEKAGIGTLTKPISVEETVDICAKIKAAEPDIIPIAYRGTGGSINGTWMSIFPNYGAGDFDKGMNSRLGEDISIYLHDLVINKIAQPYGPPGWNNLSWDDLRNKFANGDFAMVYDCDFFSILYEDPANSRIAGKLKYQLWGSDKSQYCCTYYFGNQIVANSKNKEAAWLFNQYCISKQAQRDWAVKYKNLIPTRASVWGDPDLQKWVGEWGGGTWLDCVMENVTKNAKIWMTPFADYRSVITEWEGTVAAIYNGRPTKEALDEAVVKINAITDRAGVRKPDVH